MSHADAETKLRDMLRVPSNTTRESTWDPALLAGDRGGRTITLSNGHTLTTVNGVRCRHSPCRWDMRTLRLLEQNAQDEWIPVHAEFVVTTKSGKEKRVSELVHGIQSGYNIKLDDGRVLNTDYGIKGRIGVFATQAGEPLELFSGDGPWYLKPIKYEPPTKLHEGHLPAVATASASDLGNGDETMSMQAKRVCALAGQLSEAGLGFRIVAAKSDRKWIQKVAEKMERTGTKGALHRYLGVPEDQTIPTKTLQEALENPKTSEKTRKRIQFALNMRKAQGSVALSKAIEKTMVTFRVETSGEYKGDVTAVFPETYGTQEVSPRMVMTYAHVGQHGEASLAWYNSTAPAKPEEYADLLKELRGIYEQGKNKVKLVVEQKVNWNKLLLSNRK